MAEASRVVGVVSVDREIPGDRVAAIEAAAVCGDPQCAAAVLLEVNDSRLSWARATRLRRIDRHRACSELDRIQS